MNVHCSNIHLPAPKSYIPALYSCKSNSTLSEHEKHVFKYFCEKEGIMEGREKRRKVGRGLEYRRRNVKKTPYRLLKIMFQILGKIYQWKLLDHSYQRCMESSVK